MEAKLYPTPKRGSPQFHHELKQQIVKVADNLYLTSAEGARRPGSLGRCGVTVEINTTPDQPFSGCTERQYRIPVSDISAVQINRYFATFLSYMEEVLAEERKAVVFCECGVSRSVTFCLIWLMASERLCLFDAFRRIKSMRGIANPNEGFWRQLIEYELKEFGENSVVLAQ